MINQYSKYPLSEKPEEEFFLVELISDFREPTILCPNENLCWRRFRITTINLLIRTFLKWDKFLFLHKCLTKREYSVQQTLNDNEAYTVQVPERQLKLK